MVTHTRKFNILSLLTVSLVAAAIFVTACGAQPESATSAEASPSEVIVESSEEESEEHAHEDDHHDEEHHHSESLEALVAELSPIDLAGGERLQVLASTSIVGDWVRNVAGEAVELSVLMPIGADLHSFEPTPSDLAAIADADVIFMIGLNAEERLMESLENAGGEAVLVPVSMGLELSEMAEGEGHDHGHDEEHSDEEHSDEKHADDDEHHHDHGGLDPHVWTTPHHATLMIHNIEGVLAASIRRRPSCTRAMPRRMRLS